MKGEARNLRTLYVENAHVAAAFWERRHTAIGVFLAAAAAVAASEAWFYWSHPGRLMATPVAFAAVVGYVAAHLHERTRQVLGETYSVGAMLERAMLEREPALAGERAGIFMRLHEATPPPVGPLLTWVYAGFGALALALTVAALATPPHPARVRPASSLPTAEDQLRPKVVTAYVIRSATTVGP
jgi:hypothetical protein